VTRFLLTALATLLVTLFTAACIGDGIGGGGDLSAAECAERFREVPDIRDFAAGGPIVNADQVVLAYYDSVNDTWYTPREGFGGGSFGEPAEYDGDPGDCNLEEVTFEEFYGGDYGR
jgi:hypothetical protein